MSEKEKLAELAKLAEALPARRRQELEARLPFGLNPAYTSGIVRGLALAAETMSDSPAAGELREMAAVLAVHAIEQERVYGQARQLFTAEARAEMDAEIARIESGEVEMVPFEDVIREMDEMARRARGQSGDKAAS